MNMKKLFLTGILCISGIYSMDAQAFTCSFLSGTAADKETVNFGSVLVQRDAPLGSTVATVTRTAFSSRPDFYRCTDPTAMPAQTTRWSAEATTVITYNGEQLFSVGLPGLALRVVTPWFAAGPFPRNSPNNAGCSANATIRNYCGTSWGSTTFQLVKIGDTGSGTTSTPGSFRASLANVSYVYQFLVGPSTISTVACSVSNTAVQVPLGEVNLSQFTGPGNTVGAKSFNIALNCNAGTRVQITLAGTADSSGVQGVLALSPSAGTVAEGAGVQLLHNNTPVTLGAPIATGTAAAAGAYNIPLVARYYQTAQNVRPGLANSAATFTMTYN